MSEVQIFCFSKAYDDDMSFQQKRFRAFNKEVGEKRFWEIKNEVNSIIGIKDMQLNDFWKQVTQDQWNKLLAIPEAKDFKDGFSFISGIKIGEPQIIIADKPVEIYKDKIKVGCTEVTLDTLVKIIEEMRKK